MQQEEAQQIILDDYIPYWTELWPSAKGLAQYLFDNKHLAAGKNILELGCGLGLPSLLSAKWGAQKVTATDLIDAALDHVLQNARMNEINMDNFETRVLDWTKVLPDSMMDYDLILAADIVYEKRFVNHFVDLIRKLILNAKPITLLLAEPGRDVASDLIKTLSGFPYVELNKTTIQVESKGTIFGVNVNEVKIC